MGSRSDHRRLPRRNHYQEGPGFLFPFLATENGRPGSFSQACSKSRRPLSWAPMADILEQPHGRRLGDYLIEQLAEKRWSRFRAAIAFVKESGVAQIERPLEDFARHAEVLVSVGVALGGTSIEGLRRLNAAAGAAGGIWVFHNEGYGTFHPKTYLFSDEQHASLVVGSGNLTRGGLFSNYEASLELDLDLNRAEDRRVYEDVNRALDRWKDEESGLARRLTDELVRDLIQEGYVWPERLTRDSVDEAEAEEGDEEAAPERHIRKRLFRSVAVPEPPPLREVAETDGSRAHGRYEPRTVERSVAEAAVMQPVLVPAEAEPAVEIATAHTGYVMTLQTTDVGYGQTTAGTQRRSPEVFIPLAARDADPDFWEWDAGYMDDRTHAGKKDRRVVIRIGADEVEATLYNWPDKHDFRIRTEALRRGASVGDILRLEKNGSGFDYYAEIVPQGTTMHATYLALCTNPVRNSTKRWGYY
jgi:HKD family nuclease